MDQIIYITISFIVGVVLTRLWYNVVGLGYASILMKRTINDCLLVMADNIQSSHESYEIKYEALKIAERDDKYIEFQKKIDKQQQRTLQKTIMRNFMNSVPRNYDHLVVFHDWDSAMKYLTDQLKRRI
jgi:hypothetical protein